MASIRPLAANVAEELRASLVVHSLEQCALELVQNSLDANATFIEVKVDIANHSLQVSDNGDGITSKDMDLIGTRYATSKCTTVDDLKRIKTYGFRGEAIAAIAEMSLVDLVSRPRPQEHSFSAIFKGGDRLFFGRSNKQPHFSHGTTVSVRDLFYKFPVRQRYWSDASVSKLETELEKVKRAIETLALVVPHVALAVIDMAKDSKILTCRKTDSQLQRITMILGQGLASSMSHVQSSIQDSNIYEFSGYISTMGHYSRLHQYFFLNNRPVLCENLVRAITQLFQQSSFAKDSNRVQAEADDMRRSRERHPVFVLMLKCQTSQYNICADPAKVMVEFESSKPSRTRQSDSNTANDSQSVQSKVVPDDVLEDDLEFELDYDWIASELDDDFVNNEIGFSSQEGIAYRALPTSATFQATSGGSYQRASLPHRKAPGSIIGTAEDPEEARSEVAVAKRGRTSGIWAQDVLRKWVNPVFTTPSWVGPSIPSLSLDIGVGGGSSSGGGGGNESMEKRISRFFTNAGESNHFDAHYIQLSKQSLQTATVIAQLDFKFILCTMDIHTAKPLASVDSRMSPGATDRNDAKSTSQEATATVLAVIDQHAADERVRVENLMCGMCVCSQSPFESTDDMDPNLSTNTPRDFRKPQNFPHRLDRMVMLPPLPITLTRREWNCAQQFSQWLHRWGIALSQELPPPPPRRPSLSGRGDDDAEMDDMAPLLVSHHFTGTLSEAEEQAPSLDQTPLPTPGDSSVGERHNRSLLGGLRVASTESDYIQGYVMALPRVVADRCVVDSALTQDLIKDTISWGEEGRRGFHASRDEGRAETSDRSQPEGNHVADF
ncbi:DNA mismatch repair protein [Gryganskiella cystojenkinii]|nr:DNA mismatch repair protein [Gryganskiella cystojenkinii]